MRIAYCTSHISPYMAACWRAMAARDDAQLRVVAWTPGVGLAPFTGDLMESVDHVFIDKDDPAFARKANEAVDEFAPDICIVGGWLNPAYRDMAVRRAAGARYYMAIDTPFKWNLRQRLGRYRYRAFYKSLDGVICTGERSSQLARVLGFPDAMVHRGMYGVDVEHWSHVAQRRRALDEWPRRFLYIGRLTERKGMDILIDAYTRYRRAVDEPWPLTVCGKGPFEDQLQATEGVDFRGFVQPTDLPDIKLNAGCLLLPARLDSWPLVVVESCAAGLPVVCSTSCGSLVELIREYYNGITFDVERTDHLTRAMMWMHDHHDRLPEMGARGVDLARPYSAEMWAERHVQWFRA
ncbi:MAG: hypothetical protein Tsb0013_19630 [Phycisphaerales bacterium]